MNYTELKQNIQDVTEYTFLDAQLDMFIRQTEQMLYNSVQLPVLKQRATTTLTSGNEYIGTPADFRYVHSLSVVDGNSKTSFLLNKDLNFLKEAYPNAEVGVPKHYALYDENSLIVAPTPDSNYSVEITYGAYPESIVTAGNTWLGDDFDNALLNGCLVEAARFMKAEQDIIANYEKLFTLSVGLLKNLGDGKLRQDMYRSGEFRSPAS